MNDQSKEPKLLPENDLLKPKGNPYIWLGLLLVPILFFMIGELRRDRSVGENVAPQTQGAAPITEGGLGGKRTRPR